MARFADDSSMRLTVMVIGIAVGAYALVLAMFGQPLLDLAFVARWPLLGTTGAFSLAAGLLALTVPATAGLLLVVSGAVWFGFAFLFADGHTVWTFAPLVLTVVGIVTAFRTAGATEVLYTSDRMSTWVGKFFALSIVVLTVVVCYEVFMRYVLRMPTRWAYDAGYILYGAGFFMAGAYAVAQNAHVRADVIYRFWPPRVQASVDMVLYILFFFPAAFFFIYQGYLFAERSWIMREFSSASPFNIPVYHFKTIIPISGMLLFMQGIAELLRAGLCLRDGAWPPRLSDVEEIEKAAMEGHLTGTIAGIGPVDYASEGEADASAAGTPAGGEPRQ